MHFFRLLLVLLLCWTGSSLFGQSVVDIRPLTDNILVVHLDEGTIDYHGNGEALSSDQVLGRSIEANALENLNAYQISSTDDPNYAVAQTATRLGRKSKGTEFANFCVGFEVLPFYDLPGCVNEGITDHLKEHWIYLFLAQPLVQGRSYEINVLPEEGVENNQVSFVYDPKAIRSDAIHVNNVGYATDAPTKIGYVYHWMGDAGGLDVSTLDGNTFGLINVNTNEVVYTGTLRFRKSIDNEDTFRDEPVETPNQNFLGSAVYEGDFSDFSDAGQFRFFVEGAGASHNFNISCDALRPAWQTVARSLYHNRSGIALTEPYTNFTRPAPHNPKETPGFAGRLVYTSTTVCEVSASDANPTDKALWDQGVQGALTDTWGWYQDAGDWDAYISHLDVPTKLLFLYEHYPENFPDDDLNLPESGNGLPDILDEARWLIRFYKRAKDETEDKGWTTGGVPAGRVFGDLWGEDIGEDELGRGSWQDNDRQWVLSGEDPVTTYRYAALAAHFANLLRRDNFRDPEGIDWQSEATAAFTWAENNYAADYSCHEYDIRDARAHAAAALFRLTNSRDYDSAFRSARTDRATDPVNDGFEDREAFGPYLYVTSPNADPTLTTEYLTAIEGGADFILLTSADQRATRYGGNLFFPMLVGQGTTPIVFPAIMAQALLRDSKPAKAAEYYAALGTTADYFLGSNPLNTSWVTGLEENAPEEIFDLDSRYAGHDFVKPGVVPYGPWRDTELFGNAGPFSHRWGNKTLHPAIEDWPGHERWWGGRYAPLNGEYTVWQNALNAAALYGMLAGPADCRTATSTNQARPQVQGFDLFPNPASGRVWLKLPEGYNIDSVRILDVNGREVRAFAGEMRELYLRGLPAGLYFVRVSGAGFRAVEKVVVE